MLRRMVAKHPREEGEVLELLKIYTERKATGTDQPEAWLHGRNPAPPPAQEGRTLWKPAENPKGPISLITANVHLMAATIDEQLIIRQSDEPDLHILKIPWQDLKLASLQVGTRARQIEAARVRTALQGAPEIDEYATKKTISRHNEEDNPIIKNITTLSRWVESKLADIEYHEDGKCTLCGNKDGSWEHIMKDCPHLKSTREKHGVQHIIKQIPKILLYGIAPAVSAEADGPAWKDPDRKRKTACCIGISTNTLSDRLPRSKPEQSLTVESAI